MVEVPVVLCALLPPPPTELVLVLLEALPPMEVEVWPFEAWLPLPGGSALSLQPAAVPRPARVSVARSPSCRFCMNNLPDEPRFLFLANSTHLIWTCEPVLVDSLIKSRGSPGFCRDNLYFAPQGGK